MLWNKAVWCLEVLIYKRLQIWRHNDVISRNEYLIFICPNLPFLRYIHYNFCLNPRITYGDMKENVCGCFFWTQCRFTQQTDFTRFSLRYFLMSHRLVEMLSLWSRLLGLFYSCFSTFIHFPPVCTWYPAEPSHSTVFSVILNVYHNFRQNTPYYIIRHPVWYCVG